MGLIGSDRKGSPGIDGTAAYQMICAGDMAGAWTVLSSADVSASADALYNKVLCLRAAGRTGEAVDLSAIVFRRLTEGVPQCDPDPVLRALIGSAVLPPMHPSLPASDPSYAGILARWLHCLCQAESGDAEGARRTAQPLGRLGIKPFDSEENRCHRWTTCS